MINVKSKLSLSPRLKRIFNGSGFYGALCALWQCPRAKPRKVQLSQGIYSLKIANSGLFYTRLVLPDAIKDHQSIRIFCYLKNGLTYLKKNRKIFLYIFKNEEISFAPLKKIKSTKICNITSLGMKLKLRETYCTTYKVFFLLLL